MKNETIELVEQNLQLVWSERDSEKRLKAIQKLYATDSILYDADGQTQGHEAINAVVGNVLRNFPEDFSFFPLQPTLVNHNLAKAVWGVGNNTESPAAMRSDIALIENGQIKALYVFLD